MSVWAGGRQYHYECVRSPYASTQVQPVSNEELRKRMMDMPFGEPPT